MMHEAPDLLFLSRITVALQLGFLYLEMLDLVQRLFSLGSSTCLPRLGESDTIFKVRDFHCVLPSTENIGQRELST